MIFPTHSLWKNVFLSPSLSANLDSVGKLVDDDCHVSFSKSGCVVQDRVSGKMIAKGPKCGRLFPLHLSNLRNKPGFAFLCVHSQNNWKLWHNRLGHPNPKLCYLCLGLV